MGLREGNDTVIRERERETGRKMGFLAAEALRKCE